MSADAPDLSRNVYHALVEAGNGMLELLRQPGALPGPNPPQRDLRWHFSDWAGGREAPDTASLEEPVFQESVALVFRLLFLLCAEVRGLSLEPGDDGGVLSQLKPFVAAAVSGGKLHLDPPDPGARLSELYLPLTSQRLSQVIRILREGPESGLDGRGAYPFELLEPHLPGRIYEQTLEWSGAIATEELALVRRRARHAWREEYVPLSRLTGREQEIFQWRRCERERRPDRPVSRGTIHGTAPAGSYYVVRSATDSCRKVRGAYYTPDPIVRYMVEATLGPLTDEKPSRDADPREGDSPEAAGADGTRASAILGRRIVDPSMGCGHFLLEAADYLARAHRKALLEEPTLDETNLPPLDRCRRDVIERCLFGMDRDKVAVEIARYSLWLLAPEVSFAALARHLRSGDALLFDWEAEYGTSPPAPLPQERGANSRGGEGERGRQGDSGSCSTTVPLAYSSTCPLAHLPTCLSPLPPRGRGRERGCSTSPPAPLPQERGARADRAPTPSLPCLSPLPPRGRGRERGSPPFDAALLNPPYRFRLDAAAKAAYLARAPAEYRARKPDLYLLFLLLADRLTRSEGRIGILSPATFLTGIDSQAVVCSLLQRRSIESLTLLPPCGIWENSSAECAITLWSRGGEGRILDLRRIAPADLPGQLCGQAAAEGTGTVANGSANHSGAPAAAFAAADFGWYSAALGRSPSPGCGWRAGPNLCPVIRLDEQYEVMQGIIVYRSRQQSRELSWVTSERVNGEWMPFLRGGSCLKRYCVEAPREYLHYGPWLHNPRSPRFFEPPKILYHRLKNGKVRRRLTAALELSGAYNANNFSNIIPRPDSGRSLLYLLALLNSKYLSYLYSARYPNVNIQESFVRALPVPLIRAEWRPSSLHLRELWEARKEGRLADRVAEHRSDEGISVALAEALEECARLLSQHENRDSGSDFRGSGIDRASFSVVDDLLDQVIYLLYGLSPDQIAEVEAYSGDPPPQ